MRIILYVNNVHVLYGEISWVDWGACFPQPNINGLNVGLARQPQPTRRDSFVQGDRRFGQIDKHLTTIAHCMDRFMLCVGTPPKPLCDSGTLERPRLGSQAGA